MRGRSAARGGGQFRGVVLHGGRGGLLLAGAVADPHRYAAAGGGEPRPHDTLAVDGVTQRGLPLVRRGTLPGRDREVDGVEVVRLVGIVHEHFGGHHPAASSAVGAMRTGCSMVSVSLSHTW